MFGSTPSQAGVSVTPTTAMSCPPVRAAVAAIAEGVGGLPCILYRKGEDGSRDRATDRAAYGLLHAAANDWTPSPALFEQVTRDSLLHGNGFAAIVRDGTRTPRELIRLAPEAVRVEQDPTSGEPRYTLATANGSTRTQDRRDILHIQAPSLDGVKGQSPIIACKDAIGIAMTIEGHVARLFGRGARPSGVLASEKQMSDDAKARLATQWMAAHGGGKSGGTAILDENIQFKSITLSSVEAQTLELWGFAVLQIARTFRVPPHLIFDLSRATWANAGEMGSTFLRFSLMRWVKAWQGEINLKLVNPEDRGAVYAEFLLDDLLRSDLSARATAYSQMIAARILNPNEVRAMENRAPYAGGEVFQNPNVTVTTKTTGPAEPEGDE